MNRKIILPLVLIFLIAAKISSAQNYVIEPVAGIEGRSNTGDNGPATASGLSAPWGVAVDDSGNVYISDQLNSRIQKVNTKGIITTVAGSDTAYHLDDGGPATDAGLSEPLGIAIAPSGVLYISDWNHRRIRKVDKNGIITEYGGTGTDGYTGDGGPATDAEISGVYGIITDKYGNLYLADDYNYVVRKIDTNDIITTFAGNGIGADNGDGGPATAASLWGPTGVAADKEGNIYISTARYVRKVDTNGIITTVAGNGTVGHTGDGGLATNAEIGGAFDIAVDDSNNIYIVEEFDDYIRKVYPNDTITTIAGDGVYGYSDYYGNPDTASMEWPQGIITDSFGNVFFADNNQVRELSPCSPIVTINPASPTICSGQSVLLSAYGRNDYAWSPGASLNDSAGVSVVASPTVTTTYSISGTVCYAAASIVVTVDPIPRLQVAPSLDSICQGKSVSLFASGGYVYQWNPANGLNDTVIGATVVVSPTATTTYTVMDTICLVTATATVIVDSTPVVKITPSPATTCQGQPLQLVATGAISFYWSPSTDLSDTTGNSITFYAANSTVYYVMGANSFGCSDIDTENVTVIPAPIKPSFQQMGDTLISSSQYDNQWYRNDSILVRDTSQTLIITATGNYFVSVTNEANGCSTASDTEKITPAGINQITANNDLLSVYPNPFSSEVIIKINPSVQNVNECSLQVVNVLGQTVCALPSLNYSNEIDLHNLPDGVYFLTVTNKNLHIVFSLIKQ